MIQIMLLLNCAILFSIIKLCSSKVFDEYKGSLLNPVIFYSLLNLIFILDFYYFHGTSEVFLYEQYFYFTDNEIIDSLFLYTIFNIVFIIMFNYSLATSKNITKIKINIEDYEKSSMWLFYIIVSLTIFQLLINYKYFVMFYNGYSTRQVIFSGNKLLYIMFSLIIPSFCLFLATQKVKKWNIIPFVLILILILVSGSRGNVIFAVIIYMTYVIDNKKMINPLYLIILLPIVTLMLIVSRYVTREAWRYDSIYQFVESNGGVGKLFFSTAEISLAEVLTVVVEIEDKTDRFPFESFMSGIMFYLPRNIFTFKPLGGSAEITGLLSPMRWDYSRSEILITGYGDLFLNFGFVAAYLVYAFMIYIWFYIMFKVLLSNKSIKILLMPILLWVPYVFLRADIFNAFGIIWSFTITLILMKAIQLVTWRKI